MAFVSVNLPDQARGDTWKFRFIVADPDGVVEDITANQYWLTIKSDLNLDDSNAEIQVGPIVPDATEGLQGVLDIVISNLGTQDIAKGSYNYDLQEINPSNEVTTLLIGKVRIANDVTKVGSFESGGTAPITSSMSGRALYSGYTNEPETVTIWKDGVTPKIQDINDDSTFIFEAQIVGKNQTLNTACAFNIQGAVHRDSTTTEFIGDVVKMILGRDNVLYDADVIIVGDGVAVSVTSPDNDIVKWAADIQYSEVYF